MALSLTKALASIALFHAPLQARASSLSPPPLSSNRQEWVSLSENVEFLPASMTSPADDNPNTNNLDINALEDAARFLRRAQERVLSTYSSHTFAEGASDTQYSEDATAWRLLGVYIDCSTSTSDAQQQRQRRRDRRHRVLEENADENADEENDDGGQQQQQQYFASSCTRYLLWEAYVDLAYEGGGLDEYKLFNPATKAFDLTSCSDSSSGKRCAMMDCHMPNTHFQRLGYFKEYGVYDWLEHLDTYQGACNWSQEQYSFLSSTYEFWPQGCTLSSSGNSLYYDIMPNSGGEFSIGLYTDNLCTVNYEGSMTVEAVLQASSENYNNGGGGDDDDGSSSQAAFASQEWFQQWNKALDVFKTCQPCKTVDVIASSSSSSSGRRFLSDNGQCQAAINQCAMFAENTSIQPASFRDVRLATQQGSVIATYALAGVSPKNRFKTWYAQWGFFTISTLVFVIGLVAFCCLVKVKKRPSLREPLLDGSNSNGRSSSRTAASSRNNANKSSKNSRSSRS